MLEIKKEPMSKAEEQAWTELIPVIKEVPNELVDKCKTYVSGCVDAFKVAREVYKA